MQDVLTLDVLVVDDDPVVTEFCRKVLAGAGHRVWAAADARKALELLARQEVALVLSDLKMPGMNGGEFMKKVKALHAQTRFMVMTGFGTVTSAATLMKNGAGDYLEKPFSAQALLRAVAGMLRQIRREREGHSLEELAGLWEIGRALNQGAEPESVLAKIADLSTVLTHAGRALVFLHDASTSRLKLQVNVPSGELLDGLSVDEMRDPTADTVLDRLKSLEA